ncbi:unnamed protein product, partial [marine sediment metagenome]
LKEALRYATELADALDKAHRQGVVHRDFKPLELFRVEAGKIAEHWDAVWLNLPEKFQHNNTLF